MEENGGKTISVIAICLHSKSIKLKWFIQLLAEILECRICHLASTVLLFNIVYLKIHLSFYQHILSGSMLNRLMIWISRRKKGMKPVPIHSSSNLKEICCSCATGQSSPWPLYNRWCQKLVWYLSGRKVGELMVKMVCGEKDIDIYIFFFLLCMFA